MTELIKDIWNLFLEFIGFLFDLDFTKNEQKFDDPFDNLSKSLDFPDGTKDTALTSKEIFASKEIAFLEAAFGRDTAEYIQYLRQTVDDLVKENTLEYADSVYIVLPPEKFPGSGFSPAIIDNIIERVYAQFDGDVILKPGKINVLTTDGGHMYAEMYLDYYRPTEEFIMTP